MATCLCVFWVPNIGIIGTAGREIIDQFVFNQCYRAPRSVPVTRGRASWILNSAALSLWEVWRHVSGPCSFQLSEKLEGLSSKCAVTHMQRELNRRGDHKGKKRLSDWLEKNGNIPPIALRSRNWLSNTFFVLFSFVILETTQVSRIQELSAHSHYRLDFLFSEIFPFSAVFYWNSCIRLICFFFLRWSWTTSLFLTFASVYKRSSRR